MTTLLFLDNNKDNNKLGEKIKKSAVSANFGRITGVNDGKNIENLKNKTASFLQLFRLN